MDSLNYYQIIKDILEDYAKLPHLEIVGDDRKDFAIALSSRTIAQQPATNNQQQTPLSP